MSSIEKTGLMQARLTEFYSRLDNLEKASGLDVEGRPVQSFKLLGEGYSPGEIGTKLGISMSEVMSDISEVRKKLMEVKDL